MLIERALNKTMVERTLSPVAPEEMAELSSAAEREFTKQLKTLEELRASRGALNVHRASVEKELAVLRELVKKRHSATQGPEGLRHLLLEIRGAITPLVERGSTPEWVVKDVVADLHGMIEARSSEVLERERVTFDTEIANLERRIAKLVASIESMERALDQLAKTKDLETGIASIYRTVQGLSGGEQDGDQKRLMMAAMFAANIELRQQIDLASGA